MFATDGFTFSSFGSSITAVVDTGAVSVVASTGATASVVASTGATASVVASTGATLLLLSSLFCYCFLLLPSTGATASVVAFGAVTATVGLNCRVNGCM